MVEPFVSNAMPFIKPMPARKQNSPRLKSLRSVIIAVAKSRQNIPAAIPSPSPVAQSMSDAAMMSKSTKIGAPPILHQLGFSSRSTVLGRGAVFCFAGSGGKTGAAGIGGIFGLSGTGGNFGLGRGAGCSVSCCEALRRIASFGTSGITMSGELVAFSSASVCVACSLGVFIILWCVRLFWGGLCSKIHQKSLPSA